MKFAVIGTNFISHNFMQAAKHLPEFELVAVCSGQLENAKKFAETYQVDYYTDNYQEILTNQAIDAVYIATPNSLHYEPSIYFLKNKVHVLCEKPLASNLTEVNAMIETAQANQVLLMEAIIPVTLTNFFEVKKQLPKLGTIRRALFQLGKYSSRYDSYRDGVILNAFKNELSNGSLMDMGVYSVYNVVALFGVPEKIFANAYLLKTQVDGLGSMIFSYPEMEAVLMHSKITDTHLKSEIQGEDGNLLITGNSSYNKLELALRNQPVADITVKQCEDTMYYELKEFMECIKAGKLESSLVPYQLMRDVHHVMTEIRKLINVSYPADK